MELITKNATMTSLEIAEITGKEHKNVLRDIKDEMEKLGVEISQLIFEPSTYISDRGREYDCYNLTRDGVLQIGARYDAKIRFTLIQRMNQLEAELNNPMAMYEGKSKWDLILLHAQAEKEKEELAIELKVAQPKVEYHDKVLDSSSCYTTTQIAKEVEMTARGLNILLMQMGVQFKQSKQWQLSAKYQGNGYTRVRTHVTEDGQTRHSTVWTEKGRAFVIDILEDA